MFGFEDRRTPAERDRDLRQADQSRAEGLLAIGFLKNRLRPLLKQVCDEVGLAGKGCYGMNTGELLVEAGGVTYKITVRVDHDG